MSASDSSITNATVPEGAADPIPSDGIVGENQSLGPMDGGLWRPVAPEELLKKNPESGVDSSEEDRPKVQLQRRQELEQHLKACPTDHDSYLELAAIYRSEDRPLESKRLLTQAHQLFPKNETILWELEEAILARSLQQFREVSELAGRLKSPEAQRELDRSQNDWACRRIDVCRARLDRDSSLTHLHVSLAEALYDAGIFEEAIAQGGEVLEHDEYAPVAHLLRGKCLLATGKDLQAMAELRAATMRRSVPAPARIRVIGGRLLCEVAQRLGLNLTLDVYRENLLRAEEDLSAEANKT